MAVVVGLDIGGTLAKVAYLTPVGVDDSAPLSPLPLENSLIQFRCFETVKISELIEFLRQRLDGAGQEWIPITGGGSYKFSKVLGENLGLPLVRVDEMRSVVRGLTSVLALGADEAYIYDLASSKRQPRPAPTLPVLLVNVGSGVSILKIDGPEAYARVSGTCIGGGTVLGLCKLAIGVKDFDEVIELSRRGHSENLDLSVQELIGDSAGSSLLPHDLLASSFGKLHNNNITIRKSDFANSAIRMISYNLGYLAYMLASIHKCSVVLFGGKYISDHDITMKAMTEGILFPQLKNYRSQDSYVQLLRDFQKSSSATIEPYFLKHDGFLGAVGALLTRD